MAPMYNRSANPRPTKRMRRSYPLQRSYKPESKYFNNTIAKSGVVADSVNTTAIGAGSSSEERVGRKICLKSVEYLFSTAGTTAGSPVRMILYVPKQSNQTLSLTSFADAIDNNQFWVISDRQFNGTIDNITHIHMYRHRFPMGLNVEYDGATSGDVVKNPVRLLIQTNDTTTDVSGHTKVWFTDN